MDKLSGRGPTTPRGAGQRIAQPSRVDSKRVGSANHREVDAETQGAFATALQQTERRVTGVSESSTVEGWATPDSSKEDMLAERLSESEIEQNDDLLSDELNSDDSGARLEDSSSEVDPLSATSYLALLAMQRKPSKEYDKNSVHPTQEVAEFLQSVQQEESLISLANSDLNASQQSSLAKKVTRAIPTDEGGLTHSVDGSVHPIKSVVDQTFEPGVRAAARIADIESLANFFHRIAQNRAAGGDTWHVRVLNAVHGAEHLQLKMMPSGGWHIQVSMHDSQLARSKQHLEELRNGLRSRGVVLEKVTLVHEREDESET